MTDIRFQEIETLIEDSGRCFDPATGLFESLGEEEEEGGVEMDLEPKSFFGLLGITEEECAEYVQRKIAEYDESLRNA